MSSCHKHNTEDFNCLQHSSLSSPNEYVQVYSIYFLYMLYLFHADLVKSVFLHKVSMIQRVWHHKGCTLQFVVSDILNSIQSYPILCHCMLTVL